MLFVAAAGSEQLERQRSGLDDVCPNWPEELAGMRHIKSDRHVAPDQLPGILPVPAASGPIGYPGHGDCSAISSSVGASHVDLAPAEVATFRLRVS
jgi:hypothetical protein